MHAKKVVRPVLAFLMLGLAAPALAEGPGAEETIALGRALFARQWVPGDARSHGGDGLGPVYNERSCLGCHNQGGPGGAAGADRNIELVSAAGDPFAGPGAFYAFSMNFGAAGFSYRIASDASPATPRRPTPADRAALAAIHPGFRDAPSVVLHRYGPDPDYRAWRAGVPGRHGAIALTISGRNPTPLFGVGLIDAIPDAAIEASARKRHAGWPQIRGRVNRLADGRIGRFGWKAQTATLGAFVLSAAAVELGLEVPGRHQAGDPRFPPLDPPGLDLSEDEADALIAYVRSLPAPAVRAPAGPREAQQVKAGAATFRSIGCATCHLPKLGDVDGIYSDLLLHDMNPGLGDTSLYGAFATRAEGEPPGAATVASPTEWRTPPLWGLADSAPYLHDGRAATIDEAIRLHGGQASGPAHRHAQLTSQARRQLEAFLLSLASPTP